MFENIIAQDQTVELLRSDIAAGSMPSSLLIHGPPYAGKLSLALELARVLTCSGVGAWTCGCGACARQKLLVHPDTVMLGPRYFLSEIAASSDVLRRQRSVASRYLLVRAVRKLVRRFDAELWEGRSRGMNSAYSGIEAIEEALGELEPGAGDLPESGELGSCLERVESACMEIEAVLPRDSVPVEVIRRASYWTHLSGRGTTKVLIFENAEKMRDASRNSLLKLLEEPGDGVVVILLSGNRNALIPTIRSRVRPYRLRARTRESSGLVLRRIFRVEADSPDSSLPTLEEYFRSWARVARSEVRDAVELFVEAVVDPSRSEADLLAAYPGRPRAGYFVAFCEELVEALRRLRPTGAVASGVLEEWMRSVRRAWTLHQSVNSSELLLLQQMLYRMRMAQ